MKTFVVEQMSVSISNFWEEVEGSNEIFQWLKSVIDPNYRFIHIWEC